MKYLLTLLLFSGFVFSNEVVWIKLQPITHYWDMESNFSTERKFRSYYFIAELNNQKILKAALREDSTPFPPTISLSAEEIEKIKLHVDAKGKYWLENLFLNEKALLWVVSRAVYNELYWLSSYKPILSKIEPQKLDFEFKIKSLGEPIVSAKSPMHRFSGKRIDGETFNATVWWTQHQF
jgi:hypothetical protein